MRPIGWADDVTMFDRVVMDVIDVVTKVVFVLQGMFPKSALPHTSLAFALATGVDAFGFGDVSGKSGFDQHPAGRVIGIAGRQSENGVQMIGHHHHGIDLKRVAAAHDANGLAERINVFHQ